MAKGLGVRARRQGFEFRQKIDVALPGIESAPRGRAKKFETPDVKFLAEFRKRRWARSDQGRHARSFFRRNARRGHIADDPPSRLPVRFVAMNYELGIGAAAQLVEVHADAFPVLVNAEGNDKIKQGKEGVDERESDTE